jgi:hypothetical protein
MGRAITVLILLVICCPSLADQNERFVEVSECCLPGKTRIYDLQTVHMIQPGRFTILSTEIDDGDLMSLELKVLDTLRRSYCKRPDGKYPPPTELFTLGEPDLPIASIEIESKSGINNGIKYDWKKASWKYPNKKFAIEDQRYGEFSPVEGFLVCKDRDRDEWELFREQQKSITDGQRNKEVFDCKRALWGYLGLVDIDPARINVDKVRPHTLGDALYRKVCQKVTHQTPYQSE